MEELIELRSLVQRGDLQSALTLIDELEEMSKDDKINKIYSYAVILLLHLINSKDVLIPSLILNPIEILALPCNSRSV